MRRYPVDNGAFSDFELFIHHVSVSLPNVRN